MYKILIADDEQLELMVLREALEEYFGNRCEVTAAANGREALRKAVEINADIAIIDIEMPGMNGIEASRLITDSLPECKIIILTAYSEFDYAKKSIEIGATDYLLKPTTDECLHAALDKVTAQIDAARSATEQTVSFSKKIHHLTSRLEEQLVLTVMGGYLSPEQSESLLAELDISFTSGVFAVYSSIRGLSAEYVKKLVAGYAWSNGMRVIPYEYDLRVYVLAFCATGRACCGDIVQNAAHSLYSDTDGGVFTGIGGSFEEISDAQSSFFSALNILESCSETKPVQKCTQAVQRKPIPEEKAIDYISQIRREISEYMSENYHRDIFLQTVASEMNYSETYFSKLFKQCFSRNFITYLTDVRIEAAKELLCKQQRLAVKEVGEKVGYRDPNYFTKVFRRATGQSPSEFRMSYVNL